MAARAHTQLLPPSGFWQMQLDEDSQPLTAFTIPGKGQYHWVTSPMGLLGCPASFQRLMETVLRNINNVLVYIDDVLLHTATHEEHLQVLEKVFERLHQNHLKVNLDKCVFGNKEVSYLGFMLTPEGIKPGRNKLQAIRDARPPTNIKMVRSFVGLCNFKQPQQQKNSGPRTHQNNSEEEEEEEAEQHIKMNTSKPDALMQGIACGALLPFAHLLKGLK